MACPPSSFSYNSSSSSQVLCACEPGLYLAGSGCSLPAGGDFVSQSSLGEESTFLTTVLSIDAVKRLTSSQALFLWGTALALLSWLLLCLAVRLGPLRDGASPWFRIRWWISRLDVAYSTHHWLSDRKVVMKRKTELGGMCSIARWILFIGLFSLLLYQTISKRSIEVHKIRPFNGPDALLFKNDVEFNITTISSMSCSQLRGLDTVVSGTPGSIDYRLSPLSKYGNYSCLNTSSGPAISIKCSNCRFPMGIFYISWQFVDLPRSPASAVAFQFNLTTKDHRDDRRLSSVSGIVKSGNFADDIPRTFRGPNANILKINLFPQIYRNLKNLSIIQPLFNDFLPGSSFVEASMLRASLENTHDSLVSTTLYLRFLSDYIVEVDKEKIIGPVGFLADVGGVYAISAAIFLYLMLQCERQSKRIRNEDALFRGIIARRRAQHNWDKLRKYVKYTWGYKGLDEETASSSQVKSNCSCGTECFRRKRPQEGNNTTDARKNKDIRPSISAGIPAAHNSGSEAL